MTQHIENPIITKNTEFYKTLKHINLYEWETNKWGEKKLQDRIIEIDKKEKKLTDRLRYDLKGTTAHLAKEVDKILKDKDLKLE